MKQSKNFSTWQRVPSCQSCRPWPGSRTCWWGWGLSPAYQLHWWCPVCPPQGLPHEHLLQGQGRDVLKLSNPKPRGNHPPLPAQIFQTCKRQTPLGCPVYVILHKLINAFCLPQRWGGGKPTYSLNNCGNSLLRLQLHNSITATNVRT